MSVPQPLKDWQSLQMFVMNLAPTSISIPWNGQDAPSTLFVSALVEERRLSPSVLMFARDVEYLINEYVYGTGGIYMTSLGVMDARKAIDNLRVLIDAATHVEDDPFAVKDLIRCWIETRNRWSVPA